MKIGDGMSVSQTMASAYGDQINKTMEKLSSGKSINSAADGAASLTISEAMQSQIRGINQSISNSQDGISLIQTADSALGDTTDALQRMRELAVQASNGTLSDTDRNALNDEFSQLKSEITQTAQDTTYNNKNLLDGSFNATINTEPDGTGVNVSISDMSSSGLNLDTLSIDNITNAGNAIDGLDNAINQVSSQRSDLGAVSNSLQDNISGLMNTDENTESAESQISDADMAQSMMELTKEKILEQASIAVMAHKKQDAGMVLQLLK